MGYTWNGFIQIKSQIEIDFINDPLLDICSSVIPISPVLVVIELEQHLALLPAVHRDELPAAVAGDRGAAVHGHHHQRHGLPKAQLEVGAGPRRLDLEWRCQRKFHHVWKKNKDSRI